MLRLSDADYALSTRAARPRAVRSTTARRSTSASVLKGDAAFEAGASQPPAVSALFEEWKRDGALQLEIRLKPTKTAVRSKVDSGKRHWVDGPFAESKELIAGFSILEVAGLEDAKRFAEEYAAILGDGEVDVRELAD